MLESRLLFYFVYTKKTRSVNGSCHLFVSLDKGLYIVMFMAFFVLIAVVPISKGHFCLLLFVKKLVVWL